MIAFKNPTLRHPRIWIDVKILSVKDPILEDLNDQQILAVQHFEGPALVVAGPGSGKTRVLTHRAAYLIKNRNVHESNILCVTFTNKAAKEIQERVRKLLTDLAKTAQDDLDAQTVIPTKLTWSGTFHSLCARILRKDGHHLGIGRGYVIYDSDDSESLVKEIIKDFGIDIKQIKPNAVAGAISSAKSELVSPSMYEGFANGYFHKTTAKIYHEYQRRLRALDALDFDDLIGETVNLYLSNPEVLQKYQRQFRFIMVDEYQDTNKAQYVLTKLLSNSHKNLYVVGDMSQAIYSFRGADYRNILNFQKDFPDAKIYNLEKNYRSTQSILDAAKSIIRNNSTHIPLDLWTDNGEGDKLISFLAQTEYEEGYYVVDQIKEKLAQGFSYKDIAVLYRTNAQSRNLEEHFIKNNVPYKIVGGLRFYSRKEIKDVVAYLRVIQNPKDSVSWERIINVPPRKMGQRAIQRLKENKWDLDMIEELTKIPIRLWISKKEAFLTMELVDEVLGSVKYLEWLDDGTEESKARVENIKELRSVATQFTDLVSFLENVTLIESSNKADPDAHEAVTLMTIHAAKGLEFPIVFIVGMEEGLFPHSQSLFEKEQIEEERRLCYVAITRAMKSVYLTRASSRLYFGSRQSNMPSRFLGELPGYLVEHKGLADDSKNPNKKELDNFFDELEYDRTNFSWD